MRDKFFVLCVGCQKGGTSWLHDQLSGSKHVDLGFTKEYQVFDSIYVAGGLHAKRVKRLKRICSKNIELSEKHCNLLDQINFVLDPKRYFDYFDSLWHLNTNITTVGDFSPSYSGLPAEAYEQIKTELELRGFRVKVVFIMRNPVERCWSMVRMRRRKELKRHPDLVQLPEHVELRRTYKKRPCQMFTKYERTVRRLGRVFDSSELYFGLYESMFQDESLRKLENFFELPDFSPSKHTKVNESVKLSNDLPEELQAEIIEHYKATYEFCERRFGTNNLWNYQTVSEI